MACNLELARSEAASFEEVRRSARELQAVVPRSFERAHAVADLLHAETYFYENRFEEAAEALEVVLRAWPNRTRETAMARLFLADTYHKLGNWEMTKHQLQQVIATDFSDPAENFYWAGERWDLSARAREKLKFRAREQGDTAALTELDVAQATAPDAHAKVDEDGSLDRFFPHSFYSESKAN